MKKIALIILFSLIYLLAYPARQFAQSNEEKIQEYLVNIDIQEDTTLRITESITYDFTEQARDKHGIYRYVPYYYEDTRLNYEIISVTDKTGQEHQYTQYEEHNNFVLRIGDPNQNVSGTETYVIAYSMIPGIVFPENEDYAKLHWNIIGQHWEVPIDNTSTTISFPSEIDLVEDASCFTGSVGSLETHCEINQENNQSFTIKNTRPLNRKEGITAEIKFQSDDIVEPGVILLENDIWLGSVKINDQTYTELPTVSYQKPGTYNLEFSRFGYETKSMEITVESGEKTPVKFETIPIGWFAFLQILPYFLIPLILFAIYSIWRKKGRDINDPQTVVVEFDAPRDMTPMEMGILKRIRVQHKDISATIIRFAVLGFLKIKYEEQKRFGIFNNPKYLLKKQNDPQKPLKDYEIEFFEELFKYSDSNGLVDLDKLENKLAAVVPRMKRQAWIESLSQGFFTRDPRKSSGATYAIAFVTLVLLGGIGIFYWFLFLTPSFVILGLTTFISTLLLAKNIPQRSSDGSKLFRHIQGLQMYLSIAEKERIKFHNAPEKKPETFEKLLPYAIVLNVEKEWAETFQDIYKTPPDWYEGGDINTFNAVLFTSALTRATSAATTSTISSSSSGGMGSGGGGGGGGGGSW